MKPQFFSSAKSSGLFCTIAGAGDAGAGDEGGLGLRSSGNFDAVIFSTQNVIKPMRASTH